MERSHEDKVPAQESARGGARPPGRPDAQRGEKARQQGEWAQGRAGQEPQEDYRGAPQCTASAARAPQANLIAVVALIRARFGVCAIGLGSGGIRYPASALR
jgi:hypothetical protein